VPETIAMAPCYTNKQTNKFTLQTNKQTNLHYKQTNKQIYIANKQTEFPLQMNKTNKIVLLP